MSDEEKWWREYPQSTLRLREFIEGAIKISYQYAGIADLIYMWSKEVDPKEKGRILADIQELVVDCQKDIS